MMINCKNCLADKHTICLNENCLCRNDNHGVKIPTLKDGVKVNDSKPIDYESYNEAVKRELSEYAEFIMSEYTFKTLEDTA